jgi:hypothetical protein
MSLSPFPWTPSSQSNAGSDIPGTIIPGGAVDAGDWCYVAASYRAANAEAVQIGAGYFLIHVIYTPNSDDTTSHPDQMTNYGGPPTGALGYVRRRNYRIDIGVPFQVPFVGQLSVIAGGDSDPDKCVVDIVLGRGFAPRDAMAQAQAVMAVQERALAAAEAYDEEQAFELLASMGPANLPRPPRLWPPPIVGSPQIVPATWLNVPPNTFIPFPDGAQKIEIVNDTGVAGSPTRLAAGALFGNPAGTFALSCASGIPRSLGPLAQGIACSNGQQPTWQHGLAGPIATATVWSILGG